jgi:hypothetical protein
LDLEVLICNCWVGVLRVKSILVYDSVHWINQCPDGEVNDVYSYKRGN